MDQPESTPVHELKPQLATKIHQEEATFGGRLKSRVDKAAEARMMKRTELEAEIAASSRVNADRFRRWYTGKNSPTVENLAQVLVAMDKICDSRPSAEYLLFGSDAQEGADSTIELSRKVDRVHQTVDRLYSYVRESELGVDNVVMRQSIRLLEDLRDSRKRASELRRKREADSTETSGPEEEIEPAIAGFLPDDLVKIVEECSTVIRIATLRFDYEVDMEANRETRIGRFFHPVAQNLRRGAEYQFLLPGDWAAWSPGVAAFYERLRDPKYGNVPQANLNQLRFYSTQLPLGAGFVLMDFNKEMLLKRRRFLAEELLRDYVDGSIAQCRMGKVISPAERTHGGALMDPERTKAAKIAWEGYLGSSNTRLMPGA